MWPATTSNVTTAPTSMVRLPPAIWVQWKNRRRPSSPSTNPKPLSASKSATLPRSVDNLRQGELDDVARSRVLQRRDERVDLRLGHDRLDRVGLGAEQLRDRRRLHRRQDPDDLLQVGFAHVELD